MVTLLTFYKSLARYDTYIYKRKHYLQLNMTLHPSLKTNGHGNKEVAFALLNNLTTSKKN